MTTTRQFTDGVLRKSAPGHAPDPICDWCQGPRYGSTIVQMGGVRGKVRRMLNVCEGCAETAPWAKHAGKMFPVQCPGGEPPCIPWAMAITAYKEYRRLYGSATPGAGGAGVLTMEEIGARGGFTEKEMDRFVPHWRYKL